MFKKKFGNYIIRAIISLEQSFSLKNLFFKLWYDDF